MDFKWCAIFTLVLSIIELLKKISLLRNGNLLLAILNVKINENIHHTLLFFPEFN